MLPITIVGSHRLYFSGSVLDERFTWLSVAIEFHCLCVENSRHHQASTIEHPPPRLSSTCWEGLRLVHILFLHIMFWRLGPTLASPALASPSRLARLATGDLANSETISNVFFHITSQCRIRRSIDPLFRFIEAALAAYLSPPHIFA